MTDTREQLREPYHLPDQFASMTIHHLYGISERSDSESIDSYFAREGFGLIADLLASGLSKEEIEAAVNSGRIVAAHWPNIEPRTDLFWGQPENEQAPLVGLADKAVELCGGAEEQPFGGDFVSVGAEMGSQQLALAGLIYAREQGRLRELVEFDMGGGPLYVVRDSFSGQMMDKLVPENP